MLGWALLFLVFAMFAAAFAFGGIVGLTAGIAQTLFVIFAAMSAITMIFSILSDR